MKKILLTLTLLSAALHAQVNGVFNKVSTKKNLITVGDATQIVHAWGTSQEAGFGLPDCTNLTCVSAFAWPAVFAQQMGWTVDNQAVSSSDCADLTFQGHSSSIWDLVIDQNSRNIYGHFRNDQSQYGQAPYRVDYARGCIEAQIAWLAIPEVAPTGNPGKFRATSGLVGKTGTWTASSINSTAMTTNQAGATMTFVIRGTSAYIATARNNPSTATYTVTVDGASVFDPITQSNTFSQSLDVGASTGFPVSESTIPYLIRMSGLQNATHAVVYTCVNPASSGCLVFYGAGTQTDNSTSNGPFVYTKSPENNADAQAVGNFSFNVTQLYLDEWHRVTSELSGDGLQVIGLDVTNLNVFYANNQTQPDGIHPTLDGQASIAQGMVSKATAASTPADRADSKSQNTSAAYGGFGAGPSPSPSGAGATNINPIIRRGSLWTSNNAQFGQVWFGSDGTSNISRTADDLTNSLGFGIGHIFSLTSFDGKRSNWVVPGQITSNVTDSQLGGTLLAKNGTTQGGEIEAGAAAGGVADWPNNSILQANTNRVINADGGIIYFQIGRNTKFTLTNSAVNFLVPISGGPFIQLSSTPGLPCAALVNGGTFNYIAGGSGVSDTVQVCAKDAAGNWAFRKLSFGGSQSGNLASSRVSGQTYQNTTGHSIALMGYFTTGTGVAGTACLDGASSVTDTLTANTFGATTSGGQAGFSCIIPNGYFYQITGTGVVTTLTAWYENPI